MVVPIEATDARMHLRRNVVLQLTRVERLVGPPGNAGVHSVLPAQDVRGETRLLDEPFEEAAFASLVRRPSALGRRG